MCYNVFVVALKNPLFYLSLALAIVVGGLAVGFVYASDFTEPPYQYPNVPSGMLSLEAIDFSQGVPVEGGDGGTGHYNRNGVLYVASSTGDVYLTVDLEAEGKFYIRGVDGITPFALDSFGRVGIGVPAPAYALDVFGGIRAKNGWLRTTGNTGWYSDTHGGGWYMQDSTWIRSYNSKHVYIAAGLRADGGIASGVIDLPGAGNIVATGVIVAGGNSAYISTLVGDCEWKWSGYQEKSKRDAQNHQSFNSGSCPSGKVPLSCAVRCNDLYLGDCFEDSITALIASGDACIADLHDGLGDDEYNVNVGALCCKR